MVALISTRNFKRKRLFNLGLTFITLVLISIFCLGTGYLYLKSLEPLPLKVSQTSIFYADDGQVFGESFQGEKRYWIDLENISPSVIDATIAVEDKRFFQHRGIDLRRIVGAAIADLKARAKVEGASTITQQYARNLFLSNEKSWRRKITEIVYALRLELTYSKEDILEGYLNTINYGHGAYGIEAASLYYFNKSAESLSLAEASMLAGVPKGPSLYSPLNAPEKASDRQKLILQLMKNNQFISAASFQSAQEEDLDYYGKHPLTNNSIAPYFQDLVINFLKEELGYTEQKINFGGLKVYTTLNIEQQLQAEQFIKEELSDYPDLQAALVTMEAGTGNVTSLVGGRDYKESSFNRASQAIRQPGSAFKPFLYYAALENGFTSASLLRSEETSFHFDNGRASYKPANYNHNYANREINLAEALALSDNIYAVKTHLLLGEDTLVETAKTFGITSPLSPVPSLALGTKGVSILEMTRAYNLFASGGKKVDPILVEKVENKLGDIVYEAKRHDGQILNREKTFIMNKLLAGMFNEKLNSYTVVTGQSIADKASRPYSGKSGTTATDNWMIGFSPDFTTTVWTGYDANKKVSNRGERATAKNLWIDYMEAIHKDHPIKNFKKPDDVIKLAIDLDSSQIATSACERQYNAYFIKGTEPKVICQEHTKFQFDKPNKKKDELQKGIQLWYERFFKP